MSMLMIALSGTVDEVVIPLNIQLSSGGILGNVFAWVTPLLALHSCLGLSEFYGMNLL